MDSVEYWIYGVFRCETMEPLPDALHQEAIELYREYLIIGGMPACINAFLKSGSFLDVPLVQSEILDNYIADMAKYASHRGGPKHRHLPGLPSPE